MLYTLPQTLLQLFYKSRLNLRKNGNNQMQLRSTQIQQKYIKTSLKSVGKEQNRE